MAIDIGFAGGNRNAETVAPHTYISYNNPANDTGLINHIEFYIDDSIAEEAMKIGVFYVSIATTYICRNVVTLTVVGNAGDKVEFDAPGDFTAFAVSTDDVIGCYGASTSLIEIQADDTGATYYDARHIDTTDATDGGAHDFDQYDSNLGLALYATGFVPGTVGGSLTMSMGMKL